MQGLLVFNTVGLFGGKINKRSNTWHYLIDTSLTLVILGSVTTCFIRGKFRLHEKNKSKRQSRAEDLVNHGLTIDWNWSTYIRLNWICLEILHQLWALWLFFCYRSNSRHKRSKKFKFRMHAGRASESNNSTPTK